MIDLAVWLNQDTRTARARAFGYNLPELGAVPLRRFSGAELGPLNAAQRRIVMQTPGHYGCYLAHVGLLKALQMTQAEIILVMEDDCRLVFRFLDRLQRCPEAREPWDILNLGRCGTYAYLVRRSSIDRILRAVAQPSNHIDILYMSRPGLRYRQVDAYLAQHDHSLPTDTHFTESDKTTQTGLWETSAVRVMSVLAASAVAYAVVEDADDYVQPMTVVKSVAALGRVNRAAMVAAFRSKPGYSIDGVELYFGGVRPSYKGQLSKLLASTDLDYQATDGISDGSAVRSLFAPYFTCDFDEMLRLSDLVCRITHAAADARMAAALMGCRVWQLLHDQHSAPVAAGENLLEMLEYTAQFLNLDGAFFIGRCRAAHRICCALDRQPPDLKLRELVAKIGLHHAAFGAPVTSAFFSLWHPGWDLVASGHTGLSLGNTLFVPQQTEAETYALAEERFKQVGEYDAYMAAHGYHWRNSFDADTFIGLVWGLSAAQAHYPYKIQTLVERGQEMFKDLWPDLARRLVQIKREPELTRIEA